MLGNSQFIRRSFTVKRLSGLSIFSSFGSVVPISLPTIAPNYITTSRFERANPKPETATPVQVDTATANALAGRWVGRPRIATIDYDIELEFTRNADGALVGKLIGTTLPQERKIDRPLRRFAVKDRQLNWEFPNTQAWNYAGELSADGTTIAGVMSSIQGGIRVEFKKR